MFFEGAILCQNNMRNLVLEKLPCPCKANHWFPCFATNPIIGNTEFGPEYPQNHESPQKGIDLSMSGKGFLSFVFASKFVSSSAFLGGSQPFFTVFLSASIPEILFPFLFVHLAKTSPFQFAESLHFFAFTRWRIDLVLLIFLLFFGFSGVIYCREWSEWFRDLLYFLTLTFGKK